MSFLNPIELPVKIYKSTDARAPQLNLPDKATNDEYLTIFKACLVTGYGEKQAAGWTMEDKPGNGGTSNQRAANTAIFKPPHVLMDNYRWEITETQSSLSFAMNHQGQVINDPSTASKNYPKRHGLSSYIKQLSWVMLVTDLGYYFIEITNRKDLEYRYARVSYFGQIKSGLVDDEGKNAIFWNFGVYYHPFYLVRSTNYRYCHFPHTQTPEAISLTGLLDNSKKRTLNAVEITSPVFYQYTGLFIGQQPGLLVQSSNDEILGGQLSGVYETEHEGRPVLYVCLAHNYFYYNTAEQGGDANNMPILLYLDKWEY